MGIPSGPKPYKFIGFGDGYGPKPYKIIGFGDSYGPQPYKFIGIGDSYGPKPYKFIIRGPPGGLRDLRHTKAKNIETLRNCLSSGEHVKRNGVLDVPCEPRVTLCYAIVLPRRKSGFGGGLRPKLGKPKAGRRADFEAFPTRIRPKSNRETRFPAR